MYKSISSSPFTINLTESIEWKRNNYQRESERVREEEIIRENRE
jgi:hypothetical protein